MVFTRLRAPTRCADRYYVKPIIVVALGLGVGLGISSAAYSEPYVPASDAEVLETLPSGLVSERRAVSGLRQRLDAQPENATTATTLAEQYLRLGDTSGDPRYWGYAQSALQPWWEADNPPNKVRYLRAKLREKQHAYALAIADYKALVAAQPDNVQVQLDLSNVYRVQGRYKQALQTCEPLQGLRQNIIYQVCSSPIRALTGNADQAYNTLRNMLTWARANAPELVLSNRILMAEIATALGDTKLARWDFFASMIEASDDLYLLRSYADFLLDEGEAEQVLSLLQEHTQDNGILLRAAIAAEVMQDKRAGEYKLELQRRFDEIRLRGDMPHGRYEARFELLLNHNPQKALQLARANWSKQKEPRDTRNLLEAALAAKAPDAATPAIQFLRRQKTEDAAMARLIEQIEAL